MALGLPIQLRLEPQKQALYEEEAANKGLPMATYLRQRLTKDDVDHERNEALRREINNGMAEIRALLSELDGASRGAEGGQLDQSMMLEMLLLLRAVAGPERMKMAHGELKRQGLKIWNGKE